MTSPTDVVNANLAAYNARDLDAFMVWIDPAIEIVDLRDPAATLRGGEAVRARYASLFATSPALYSRILHRTVLGDLVTDHELVTGRVGGDVEILITYQIEGALIRRIWSARSPITGPVVVRARPADAAALIALGRTTYTEHFAAIWSAGGLQRFLDREFAPEAMAAELAATSVVYLLALAPTSTPPVAGASGSSLVGFAKLRLPRAMPGTDQPGVELQKIYVRSTAVGQRLGARLLAAAEAEARAAGYPLLWLDVLKTNTGAIRFYQHHDLHIVGEQPFATDLAEHGLWLMRKELAADPSG